MPTRLDIRRTTARCASRQSRTASRIIRAHGDHGHGRQTPTPVRRSMPRRCCCSERVRLGRDWVAYR